MNDQYGEPVKGKFTVHKRGNGIIYLSSSFTRQLLATGWNNKSSLNCIQVTPGKDGKIRFLIEVNE